MSDLELVKNAPQPDRPSVLDALSPQLSSGQTSPLGRPSKALAGAYTLPFADYLKHPALSRSTLEKIRKSPLHLQHYLTHGEPDTAAFLQGRVLHRLLLEPLEFWQKTVVWPTEFNADLNAGGSKTEGPGSKTRWNEFKLKNADKDIITEEEQALFREIEETWRVHPQTRGLMVGAAVETAAFWRFGDTPCKGRADIVQGDVIYDVKTTSDLSAFEKDALKWGYHRQAAWYLDGFTRATGREFKAFKFIVVEKSLPADFAVFTCTREFIEAGREENAQNLALYERCVETGEWPGFAPNVDCVLALPAWRRA